MPEVSCTKLGWKCQFTIDIYSLQAFLECTLLLPLNAKAVWFGNCSPRSTGDQGPGCGTALGTTRALPCLGPVHPWLLDHPPSWDTSLLPGSPKFSYHLSRGKDREVLPIYLVSVAKMSVKSYYQDSIFHRCSYFLSLQLKISLPFHSN